MVDARVLDLVYLFTASFYSAFFPVVVVGGYAVPFVYYWRVHMRKSVNFKQGFKNFLLAISLSKNSSPLFEHFPLFVILTTNNILLAKG